MATKTEQGYAQALKKYEEAKQQLQAIQGRERSFKSLFTANKEGANALKQFKEAERELARWTKSGNLAQGMLATGVDVVLGLPDLAVQGINFGIRKAPEALADVNLGTGRVSNKKLSDLVTQKEDERFQIPVPGDIVKDALGLREQSKTEELQVYQDTPGYIAMALGAGQLLKLGWKGFTKYRNSKAVKELLASLPTNEANAFRQYMVKGQGTDSTEMQALLLKLQQNPKYAELFNALEEGARAELAVGSILPDVAITEKGVVSSVVDAFNKRLEAMRNYRSSTSGAEFNKARKLAGDSAFITVDSARKALADMRERYGSNTPDGKRILAYIDELEDSFFPRITIPAEMSATGKKTELVLRGAQPNLTIKEFQAQLSEMGRKVGINDALGSGIASDVKDTINKAVFGGLSDDLNTVTKAALSPAMKQAAGHLVKARELYKKGSDAISDAQAQGVPTWLKGTKPNSIDYTQLANVYKNQSAAQNASLRSWLQDNAPDAVAKLDKFVFDDFIKVAEKRLSNGEVGYDLGTLAEKWATLPKDQRENIAMGLGQSAVDFNKKMADALVVTKQVRTGGNVAQEASTVDKLTPPVAVAVGASGGYQLQKATQLAGNVASLMTKRGGLTEEQLMKALLTKEGAAFLKQARLSPQGTETLNALMALDRATLPNVGFISAGVKEANEPPAVFDTGESEVVLPDTVEKLSEEAAKVPELYSDDIVLPNTVEELMGSPAPQEPQNAPEQPTSDPLGEFIQNLPQKQSMAPQQQQEDPLMARIRAEGFSNPEYVYNAVMTGDPKKRELILSGLAR